MTLVTVMAAPVFPSVAMKASRSSFPAVVVNAGLTMVLELVLRSVETLLSKANPTTPAAELKLTPAKLAPLTVSPWLGGVKVNPELLGVTT